MGQQLWPTEDTSRLLSQFPIAAPFFTHQSQASKRPAPNEDPVAAPLAKKSTQLPGRNFPTTHHGSQHQIPTEEGQASLLSDAVNSQVKIDTKKYAPDQTVAADRPHSPANAHRVVHLGDLGGSGARTTADGIDAAIIIADSAEITKEGTTRDVDAADAEGRIRRHPRGWDVPPPAQAGGNDQSATGTFHQSSTAIRSHQGNPSQVGPNRNSRRHRSASVGNVMHPYIKSPRRQFPRGSRTSTPEHDPWPIRTPSPNWSPGTPDSRQGALSPPQMPDSYYVPMDTGNMAFRQGRQGHDGDEAQSSATYPSEGIHLQQDRGDNNEGMEINQGAMAPAHEAPRAP